MSADEMTVDEMSVDLIYVTEETGHKMSRKNKCRQDVCI
jgi:hypothetical protein